MKAPVGTTITVTSFRFVGNNLIGSDKLEPLVAQYLNRPLDFSELQKAAMTIAGAYREAGWIVRAYLPQQEIKAGIVTIQVVEALFGGIHWEGASLAHANLSRIQAIIDAQQKVGEPLNADALDRALLLASDLPDVAVSGSLKEGVQDRHSDLILKFTDKPLYDAEAALDNTGSRGTGRSRVSGNVNFNSPLGFGEVISANLLRLF